MKKLIVVVFMILMVATTMAQDTIRGSYSYTYGDSESLVEARQTCKDLAVRDAIESYYIFVESSTEVENATLKEDIINTLSAGYLKNLTVVDQTEEGRILSSTVEAEINPDEVQALVQKMVESSLATPQTDNGMITSLSADQAETLETLLDRYEKRMAKTETDWNRKNYNNAYNQVQELQKQLEAHVQRGATPFQKSLYLCVHKRTVLVKHLIRLEQAEQFAQRKIYVRSEVKQVTKDAVQLRDAIHKLKYVQTTTDQQNVLRDIWVKKCQATLGRVKQKVTILKNR